ncbi:MAG: hypothetical protein EHM67_15065, partial [Hyphomicrobiaceae bacterium]
MKSVKKSSRTMRSNLWTPSGPSSGRPSSTSSAIPSWSAPSPLSPTSSTHSDAEMVLEPLSMDSQPAVAALDKDGAAYAALAGLQLAKAQVDAGQRDAAIATLRALRSDDPALSVDLQSRLARLLTDAGKPAEALKVLGDNPQA